MAGNEGVDPAEAIWLAALSQPGLNVLTVRGRAALDEALRAGLRGIEDAAVRAHSAELLRGWRSYLIGAANRVRTAREELRAAEAALAHRMNVGGR